MKYHESKKPTEADRQFIRNFQSVQAYVVLAIIVIWAVVHYFF